MRLIPILLIVMFIPQVYSISITEIHFIDDEFIELVSNTTLNLTNNFLYDESGPSKFNTLTLLQEKDSKYYLIIGEKFVNSYNVTSLNCTIYITDKSQVSNGGLKSSGEDIIIEINKSINLSYQNNKDYSFDKNQSLHLINDELFISNLSPCLPTTINNVILNSTPLDNFSNTTQELCNYNFSIRIKERELTDKIQFDFLTQEKDFQITYWIEDFNGNLKSSKRTTQNTNIKSFTPLPFTQVFKVKAELRTSECYYNDNKTVVFYSTQLQEIIKEESSNSKVDKKSKLQILNKEDLLGGKNEINIEAYRGDTSKRTISLFVNSKKSASFELPSKYSRTKQKFTFTPASNSTTLSVEGLDLTDSITLTRSIPTKNKEIIPKPLSKSYFNLSLLNITSNVLFAFYNTNINLKSNNCQIYYKRTPISTPHSLVSKNSLLQFKLNIKKLQSKIQDPIVPLKLQCSYIKNGTKTQKYSSLEFNYSIPKSSPQSKQQKLILTNISTNFTNSIEKESLLSFLSRSQPSLTDQQSQTYEKEIQETLVYKSKQEVHKENSYFGVLGALTLLSSLLIIKW